MKQIKKVVYSCITGGYDDIPIHNYVDANWDYVMFTDNRDLIKRGKYEHWTIRPLAFDKLTNVKNARWHKVNAHILFPEYDYSLWIDSNIIVNNENLFQTLDKLITQKCPVAVPNHPLRTCIYDEAAEIKRCQIDFPKTVDAEMNFLKRKHYPKGNGLSETNILLRKHNDITETLDLWWKMIEKYSKRDQLSFNYALWQTGVPNTPIYTDENGFGIHRKSDDFTFVFKSSHNQNKITKQPSELRKFVVRLVGCFIPIAKYRRKFKQKLMGK